LRFAACTAQKRKAQAVLSVEADPTESLAQENLPSNQDELDIDQVRLEQLNSLHTLEEAPASERSPKSEQELTQIKQNLAALLDSTVEVAPFYIREQKLTAEDLEKIKSDPQVNRAINERLKQAIYEKSLGKELPIEKEIEHAALRELMLDGLIGERKVHTAAVSVVGSKLVQAGLNLEDRRTVDSAARTLAQMDQLAEYPRLNPEGTVDFSRPRGETLQRLQVESLGIASSNINRYQVGDLINKLGAEQLGTMRNIDQFVRDNGMSIGLYGSAHALSRKEFVQDLMFAASIARFREEGADPRAANNFLNALGFYGIDTYRKEDLIVDAVSSMPKEVDRKGIVEVLTSKEAEKVGLSLEPSHIQNILNGIPSPIPRLIPKIDPSRQV